MSKVKAIRNEAGYEQALARIDALVDAAPTNTRSYLGARRSALETG